MFKGIKKAVALCTSLVLLSSCSGLELPQETTDQMKEIVTDAAKEAATEKVNEIKDSASDKINELKDSASEKIQDISNIQNIPNIPNIQDSDETPEYDPEYYSDYGLTVHYINVGQGDCVLIQIKDHNILVDAGNNDKGTLVQKYLLDHNVSHLDFVISTHGDADHCGGLDVILEKFPCDKVYMSYLDHDTRTYEDVKNVIKNRQIPVAYPLTGELLSVADLATIQFISPSDGETESNAASIAFILYYGNCSYMFCGDAENISVANNTHVNVLMCPHHGSYTGNTVEENISYDYAVISCSGVDYGHPHNSTVDILRSKNIPLFRTDKQGNIVSHCNGADIIWDEDPCNDYTPGLKQ